MSLNIKTHCKKCSKELRYSKDYWQGQCKGCVSTPDSYPVLLSIDQLKKHWPPTVAGSNKIGRMWSTLAYQCLMLSRDCSRCPINHIYGWEYPDGNCNMPESVQRLLDDGIKPNRFEMSKVNREILG